MPKTSWSNTAPFTNHRNKQAAAAFLCFYFCTHTVQIVFAQIQPGDMHTFSFEDISVLNLKACAMDVYHQTTPEDRTKQVCTKSKPRPKTLLSWFHTENIKIRQFSQMPVAGKMLIEQKQISCNYPKLFYL